MRACLRSLKGSPVSVSVFITSLSLLISDPSSLSARPKRPVAVQKRDAQQNQQINTPVNLKGVSFEQLSAMKSPRLLDVQPLEQQLSQALSGLEALTFMSKMVPEEHAQKALIAQIEALKATISALQSQLTQSPSVDYSVPPPPPVVEAEPPRDERRKERRKRRRPKAMSATRLSQLWSSLEAAPFRDEKMIIIRQISREDYLTAEQAEVFVKTLSFSDDKRDAITTLYPKLIDPEGVERLYRLLDHSSDRKKARKEIDRINLHRRQTQGRQDQERQD
jgi:hypothetical protein